MNTAYLYINGLGTGQTKPNEMVAFWWWRRAGLHIEHAHIDWYDGKLFIEKL